MKIKSTIILLLSVLFITISIDGKTINANNSKIKSFLDSLTSDEFSGTILVAHKDKIIEKRAYGYASIEHKSKNNIDTIFNIASITKMITAAAVLQLYEDGKVELNVPIGTYLPSYPNKGVRDSVTIHQLLTHTSGLNNFYVTNFEKTDKLKYEKISDFVPLFATEKLLSKPGAKYNYSGSGFVVLGVIIEKVTGKSYYEYVKKNIFEPAEMEETTELHVDSIVQNKASGYTTNFGESKMLKRNDYYLAKASPAGFHYSTAEDLFKFSRALRNHNILKKNTVELMFTPKVKGYNTHLGYGVDVDQRYNQTILGHSGGWYGIHTELMDFKKDKYTVVILSNIDDGGKTGASKVADFFRETIADKKTDK